MTVSAMALDSAATIADTVKILGMPDYATINFTQDTETHYLSLPERSDWRVAFQTKAKKYLFEKDASGDNGKSLVQINLNTDGSIKESVTYFSDASGKKTELRYTSFLEAPKFSNTTICWSLKSCITLNHEYCMKLLRAQKEDKLQEFLNAPTKKDLTELQILNEYALFGSSANKHLNFWKLDPIKPGNHLPRLVAEKATREQVSETHKVCQDLIGASKLPPSKTESIRPIRKRAKASDKS